jgi:adenylate cyclase
VKKGFPLHINILVLFTTLICVIVLSIILYGSARNADIALMSAKDLLRRSGATIVERTRNLFDSAFMTARSYATFPDIKEKPSVHSHPMAAVFLKYLEANPDMTAVFIGFADGDFFLISTLADRPALRDKLQAPQSAAWYIQTIAHRDDRTRYEYVRFLDADYVTLGSAANPRAGYDPRTRPWYATAINSDDTSLSDVYPYALSNEPGITVSRRFDGQVSGVVGIDISLGSLTRFLEQQNIDGQGDIAIFRGSGKIYVHPGGQRTVDGKPPDAGSLSVSPAFQTFLAGFVRHRIFEPGSTFTENSVPYLTHVSALPSTYGKDLYVGLVMPQSVFTRPIERVGRQTLLISLAMLTLFFPVVYLAAKRISKPLNALTVNVDRIKSFDLDTPVPVHSVITEIQHLERATEAMRNALGAFARYIPTPLVKSMLVNDITPELGGERKVMTFLFSDIQDFTTTSETLSPERLTGYITRYLKVMGRAILESGGTIDKYIGDAVMAFWNAPVSDEAHARDACLAALRCQAALRLFNEACRMRGDPVLVTRMGVHTGEAVVGNIGSMDRMAYTAMGATVNLASRLEGLNKYLGTEILVSETTLAGAGPDMVTRFAGIVVPKGTSTGIRIYELLGTSPGASGKCAPFAMPQTILKRIADWERAFALYLARDFQGAQTAFSRFMDAHGQDRLGRFYLDLAREYTQHPPPPEWAGEQSFAGK